MERKLMRLSAAAVMVFAASAAACSPVQTFSGFRPDRNDVAIPEPQVGVDTRDTIRRRFGSPSTTAVFDQTAWYYLSAVQEQIAFYSPRTTQRQVMVVRFDGETVSAVEKFGIERGRVIAYSDEETPTRGRELSVIEQLLGNVGAAPPIRPDAENPRDRR